MSQSQSQNPYASPSQLGVRPAAALSAGLLSQSFAWMFVGLLLTAAVSWVIQGSPTLLNAAAQWYLPVLIAQIVLVIAISGAINKLSASAALGLFLVYAALMGVTLSFIFIAYELGLDRRRVRQRSGDVRRGGGLRRDHEAVPGLDRRLPVHGPDRDHHRVVREPVPAKASRSAWSISVLGVLLFVGLTAFHVQRIAQRRPRRLHRLDGEGCGPRGVLALPRLHQHLPVPAPDLRRPALARAAGSIARARATAVRDDRRRAAADRRAHLRPRRDLVRGRPGRRSRAPLPGRVRAAGRRSADPRPPRPRGDPEHLVRARSHPGHVPGQRGGDPRRGPRDRLPRLGARRPGRRGPRRRARRDGAQRGGDRARLGSPRRVGSGRRTGRCRNGPSTSPPSLGSATTRA